MSGYDKETKEEKKKQKRGHAVCLPSPAQSHIGAMLKLAKLLHQRAGFRITFVNTEFNHARFLSSHPSFFSTSLDDFQFVTIPDGLPPPFDPDADRDVPDLCEATRTFMPLPFSRLVAAFLETSSDEPGGISCILCDGFMSFAATPAARQFNVPLLFFWPVSASSFLAPKHYRAIKDKLRPLAPHKDASSSEANTFLDTVIDWVPGMKGMRVRDLPNSASHFKYAKHGVGAPDQDKLTYSYSWIEGDAPMNIFEKISYDIKIEANPEGGSICKNRSKYYATGNIQFTEEQINEGKEKVFGLFNALEGYL
ncbi:7-deoxyloganetin glucosyltransferase-like [Rhodamnia argentea]|uniref:7-deoxyloganetin glucosyltransferase-like n=1 Tax=Rhodamnia argentea TaxID=178133 RepID=A0ABM3HUM1_9MYRT|nr:7-deoxyloganetin glucosyltransferase-like [Rhodamnia argentea]